MNVFYLHGDPKICARQHVDRHVVKMILEYAQLLSTAHRVLDGLETERISARGRNGKVLKLPDTREAVLYKATHVNHPSARWVRHSIRNYRWLFRLWIALLEEYTYRYGKVHACARLTEALRTPPGRIPAKEPFSAPWRVMPEEYKTPRSRPDYTVRSYRSYYNGAKRSLFSWTNRRAPRWIVLKERNHE